jgi:hypothetical protein
VIPLAISAYATHRSEPKKQPATNPRLNQCGVCVAPTDCKLASKIDPHRRPTWIHPRERFHIFDERFIGGHSGSALHAEVGLRPRRFTWYGLGAPKGTPAEVIDKINEEVNSGLVDPNIKARIADFGGTVFASSPAEFGNFIADETEKWAKVIREANIKR